MVFTGINTYAQQEEYSWGNVPIGGGGFVSAIIPSHTEKDLVYARTDVGGAYRWNATDKTWIPLNDWSSEDQTGYLGIESLATDPENPENLYMLVGISYFNGGKTAILKSNDYGETFSIIDVSSQFKAHGNGMGRQTGEKLVIDPNNTNTLYCGTRWNGLFKSTNAGTNWSRLSGLNVTTTPNENGISFVVLDDSDVSVGNTQTIYAGVSRSGSTNLYKSTDGGTSFSAVSGAPTDLMPHRAVLASDGNLYITYADGAGPHAHWAVPEPMENGAVWKLNTNTGAWTNITPAGYTRAFGGVTVDPTNPQRIVISTINTYLPQDNAYGDRVLITTNGGSSWTDVMANGVDIVNNGVTWIDGHAIHWAGSVEFDPFKNDRIWITSGNGVFINEDISASPSIWNFEVDGLEETVPLDIESIIDGPLVSVIGDYDGFTHNDVTDYAPIHTPRMGTTTGLDVAEQDTDVRLRVGNDMYYTRDGGSSWTKTSQINGEKGRVAVSADGAVFLHSPEESSTTYRSTDNGASWSQVNGLSFNYAKPTADAQNANTFYAYDLGSGNFYVSTDKGSSFSSTGNIGANGSEIIRVNPYAEGDIWVALYNGGLKHSTDGGQSFSSVSSVTQCGAVGLGKSAPGKSYPTVYIWGTVGGVKGVYKSVDQGSSWTRINDDAHQYGGPGNGKFVIGDWNEYGRVYMSTAGRGIVTGYISSSSNLDCYGVENGTAAIDDCDVCSGGSTGIEPNSTCEQDCNNEWGGTAAIDDCDVCSGGSTGIEPNSTCCNVPVKNDTICEPGTVEFEITESGDFSWYDVATGGDALETGLTFSTTVSASQTFYVERATTTTETFGRSTKDESSGWGGDNLFEEIAKQIKITVTETVQLEAVSVFVITNGTDVQINLTDLSNSENVGSGTSSGLNEGKQRIELGIELQPGTYSIDAIGTSEPIFFQSASADFPYSSSDGSISFSNYQDWATGWYGFFYDWEVSVGGSCTRTAVDAVIDPSNSNCTVTSNRSFSTTGIEVYPNPFAENFTLNLEATAEYELYNTSGILIEKGTCNGSCEMGSRLKKGIYQIKITTDNHTEFRKVIKQ